MSGSWVLLPQEPSSGLSNRSPPQLDPSFIQDVSIQSYSVHSCNRGGAELNCVGVQILR